MPQRRRNSKAPSSCVSRIGREILKPSSSTSTSASSAVGSKRRSPVDTSNFAAVVPTSKQQRFTVSPAEEQSRPYHSDLSRTDSGVGFSETSAASAETQLLCTEAFGLEDESSSVPTDQSSEGDSDSRQDIKAVSPEPYVHQSVGLPKDLLGASSDIPGPQEMIIELTSLYGFSAYAVQLGTSYFARICRVDHGLLTSALQHPILAPLVCNSKQPGNLTALPATRAGAGIRALCPAHKWVMAILLVCIFIAAKNVESLRYRRLLPSMLSHALHLEVEPAEATCIEMECLQALEWRLGPHFHPARST